MKEPLQRSGFSVERFQNFVGGKKRESLGILKKIKRGNLPALPIFQGDTLPDTNSTLQSYNN